MRSAADMRAQMLCSRGNIVVKVDNRGSFRRGLDFEGALRERMGTIEVKDQAAAVEWLK